MKIGHEPGLQIEQLLKRVRLDVSNTTARQQFPWESSSLTVEFSFFPAGSAQERAAPANNRQPGGTAKARSETRSVDAWQRELKSKTAREAYEIVVREDQVEGYQAYLALYPSQSTAPALRSLSDRRQVMVAWYTAVTVNTVASYQAFLASYATSDFAATADRLIERARTRSVSGGAATAFASVGPTCPCSLPATPTLRQRRADTNPTQTPTQNTSAKGGNSTGTSVAVVDPTPVMVRSNPVRPIVTPPVVVVPPRISIYPRPRDHDPKPPRGTDYPKSTSDKNYPRSTAGSDKGKYTGSSHNDGSPISRGRDPARSMGGIKSASTSMATGVGGRATSMAPRASLGIMGMGRSMGGGGMSHMSFGRGR